MLWKIVFLPVIAALVTGTAFMWYLVWLASTVSVVGTVYTTILALCMTGLLGVGLVMWKEG